MSAKTQDVDKFIKDAAGLDSKREKEIGQHIGYRYDVNLVPDYNRLTPFLKKYLETMGWDDLNWLEDVLDAGKPVLGLCYGHQMLGHVLGGKVGPLPGGPEIGVADISLNAADDPLFSACAPHQRVAVIHWQTILHLPPGAHVLGFGKRDPHQAIRFAKNVWGVQFHPEFSRAVMVDYVEACADEIDETGLDPKTTAAEMAAWTEDQTHIIARFASL